MTSNAAVKAYEQAGLPVPAMAAIATSNEFNCKYLAAKAEGKAWQYLALDGSTADIRFALRHAMAAFQGLENDEPLGVVPYVYADSTAGIDPKCDETAPPDADLSSLLPPESCTSSSSSERPRLPGLAAATRLARSSLDKGDFPVNVPFPSKARSPACPTRPSSSSPASTSSSSTAGGRMPPRAPPRPVVDPATGMVISSMADGGAQDVDAAVKAARAAFENGPWRSMSPNDRSKILWRIGELIDAHAVELAELDVLDEGSPYGVVKDFYVSLSADHFRYFAGWANKIEGSTSR